MTWTESSDHAELFVSQLTRRRAIGTLGAAALALTPGCLPARQARESLTLLDRSQVELPAGAMMAWRVVRDVAEVGTAAAFERRALGFTVASAPFTTLLLTNEATGSTRRLNPGQAAFVFEGTMQRRESLGHSATSYLRIGLVAAPTVNDAGGDRLIFAGPTFAAPSGNVTLNLERVALNAGERAYVTPGRGQALVLVEQGELDMEQGEATVLERLQTVVGCDTSYAVRSLPGGTTLFGLRDATRVLVATLR
jgi:hypothetical protein